MPTFGGKEDWACLEKLSEHLYGRRVGEIAVGQMSLLEAT